MPKKKTTTQLYDGPEFIVCREVFDSYFDRPLPNSSFHDLVHRGQVIPWPHMRGRYYLNASLLRLSLPTVSEMPKASERRSLEEIARLAFTLIDRNLFPEPAWLLREEAIDAKDADHVILLANRYRDKVESFEHVELKLAYFQGVIDWASMEASADL